jgi:aquaporin Z
MPTGKYFTREDIVLKKYIAEFIGTAVLVTFGCGTAMLVGCSADNGTGYLLTALAFGLSIVAMAYSIGNISGCHVNPAVSLGVLLTGGMSMKDFIGYVIAQILGALFGSAVLECIFYNGGVTDTTGALGANGLAGVSGSAGTGFLVELILTFVFVMAVLGVTSSKAGHGSFGGLVIGLSLTFVHILGIGLTGTSVNPARSIGPAVVSAIAGNAEPMGCLWVFILAPLAGGALAAFVYKFLESGKE